MGSPRSTVKCATIAGNERLPERSQHGMLGDLHLILCEETRSVGDKEPGVREVNVPLHGVFPIKPAGVVVESSSAGDAAEGGLRIVAFGPGERPPPAVFELALMRRARWAGDLENELLVPVLPDGRVFLEEVRNLKRLPLDGLGLGYSSPAS